MTIGELLAWAYEETQMAEAIERLMETMPDDIRPSLARQVAIRRERSRWLDQQVEEVLNAADERAGGGEVP
jgi:hypothetical protein